MKLLSSLGAVALLFSSCTAPAADFDLVGREVSRMLQESHYARLPFNKQLGARIFDDYLEDLDPEHLYFTAQDVSYFSRKYRRTLHEALLEGRAMEAAEEIHAHFQKRANERIMLAQKLLKEDWQQVKNGEKGTHFTFSGERFVPRDRTETKWIQGNEAATTQWKEEVESLLLNELIYREDVRHRATEQGKPDPFKDQPSAYEKLISQYERILQKVEKDDTEDIANYLFSAVARAHDPHTEYFSARETDQFYTRLTNRLVGIGATLVSEEDGTTRITGIVIGGPADTQGELPLDARIIAVDPLNKKDWVDTRFMELDKVIELIKGKPKTTVGLRIEGETPLEISIPRGLVKMKEDLSMGEILQFKNEGEELKIGLLHVPSFYYDRKNRSGNVSVHTQKILKRMNEEKVDGLLIDMRSNGGGSLPEVTKMAGQFIGRGPVVQVKSANGHITSLGGKNPRKPIFTKPVVLLTNKFSASATEIFAAALQDYNRAVVVGSYSTFGKGTVQTPDQIARHMPIFADRDRAGELKYTIQKYYRASGGSVQQKGVIPNIILPSSWDSSEIGEQYADYALPFDIIRKARGFQTKKEDHLFIPTLKEKSSQRMRQSPDFNYVKEDVARIKKRREENRQSLNRTTRDLELKEREERRKKRFKEMRTRFAKLRETDQAQFSAFRLTLDDIKAKTLPPIDRTLEKNRYIRKSKDEISDLDDTPEWPNDLDHVEREGLSILRDLISLKENGQASSAKKNPAKS